MEEQNLFVGSPPGHITKLATMPIYGKNPVKSSPQEPVDRFS